MTMAALAGVGAPASTDQPMSPSGNRRPRPQGGVVSAGTGVVVGRRVVTGRSVVVGRSVVSGRNVAFCAAELVVVMFGSMPSTPAVPKHPSLSRLNLSDKYASTSAGAYPAQRAHSCTTAPHTLIRFEFSSQILTPSSSKPFVHVYKFHVAAQAAEGLYEPHPTHFVRQESTQPTCQFVLICPASVVSVSESTPSSCGLLVRPLSLCTHCCAEVPPGMHTKQALSM
jgi:hypothetical protein